jgi:4-amino-4-deoxychorismate lyase
MCLLFETIRIYNGNAESLQYHQQRMNRSCQAVFGAVPEIDLVRIIRDQDLPGHGTYKMRIVYGRELNQLEILPYNPPSIKKLILVNAPGLVYDHKYSERSGLNSLRFQYSAYEEIIIVQDGLLTDTTFTNIALYDGTAWFTPEKPLLPGTRRQRLLDEGRIITASIKTEDLKKYQKISLINAMLDLGDCTVETSNVSD